MVESSKIYEHTHKKRLIATSCGIYLLGYLKWAFCYPLPKTLNDFDANVDQEIKQISNYVKEFVFFLILKKK